MKVFYQEVCLSFTLHQMVKFDQVGFTRTKGKVIDFVSNNSYIEIGGHSMDNRLVTHSLMQK